MNIGFFGTGLMGFPMCEQILIKGHKLTAYNRTLKKAFPLQEKGAFITENPSEVINKSECIITMLTNTEAIKEVFFKNSSAGFKGKTFIQMGTIMPSDSRDLKKELKKLEADFFEAPVLGTISHVRQGKLQIMVGAEKALFDKWIGVLKIFGPDPVLIGETGSAAALKLALNHLIAGLNIAFSGSVAYIEKEGIELESFMNILRDSSLYAKTFDNKLERIVNRKYDNPNFPTKHLLKDISFFQKEALKDGINTKNTESLIGILQNAVNEGHGDEDYSSLYEIINPAK
jgi:3-hydroxyisobutyrate dehydrogenase